MALFTGFHGVGLILAQVGEMRLDSGQLEVSITRLSQSLS